MNIINILLLLIFLMLLTEFFLLVLFIVKKKNKVFSILLFVTVLTQMLLSFFTANPKNKFFETTTFSGIYECDFVFDSAYISYVILGYFLLTAIVLVLAIVDFVRSFWTRSHLSIYLLGYFLVLLVGIFLFDAAWDIVYEFFPALENNFWNCYYLGVI